MARCPRPGLVQGTGRRLPTGVVADNGHTNGTGLAPSAASIRPRYATDSLEHLTLDSSRNGNGNGAYNALADPPDVDASSSCAARGRLRAEGRPVDESAAKPMERASAHLLAMRAGEQVHREALIEARGQRPNRTPVCIGCRWLSRRCGACWLQPPQGQPQLLAREGESYRLVLPEDSDVDGWQVDAHLASPRLRGRPGSPDPRSRRSSSSQPTVDLLSSATARPTGLSAPGRPPGGDRRRRCPSGEPSSSKR